MGYLNIFYLNFDKNLKFYELTEKTIKLEAVALNEFFGIQNENIKEIAKTYPQSKIISRGDEIYLKGPEKDVNKLEGLFEKLLSHFEKTGKLTLDAVKNYIEGETINYTFDTTGEYIIQVKDYNSETGFFSMSVEVE